MKQVLKSVAGEMLVKTRLFHRSLRGRAVILAFHRVTDSYKDGLTLGVRDFEKFCEFVKVHFNVVSLRTLVSRLEQNEDISNLLAITFDDGYEDNFLNAAPILERLKLPATIFVVSEFIDSSTVAWWDKSLSPVPRWMTWNQVADLSARGFDIGGHTLNHVDLGNVHGADAESEIYGCKSALQERLSREVDLFAYPYGGVANCQVPLL